MCASRTRELLQDAVEALERLVGLLLLVGEEAVDVEREVVLREPRIVLQHAGEEIARRLEVRLRRRTALIDGLRLPRLEPLDELLALELPLQLAEAEERLGHLARLLRRLADEGGEQADGLGAQRLDLRDVAIDARLELLLELLLQRIRDLRSEPRSPARALERRRAPALRTRAAPAGFRRGFHVERLLGGRLDRGAAGRGGGRRRGTHGRRRRAGDAHDQSEDPEAHAHDRSMIHGAAAPAMAAFFAARRGRTGLEKDA
jgi:hypothetical protein